MQKAPFSDSDVIKASINSSHMHMSTGCWWHGVNMARADTQERLLKSPKAKEK